MELPRHDNRQVGGTGQPSTEEYRYRRVLDQRVLKSEKALTTKADIATTLAGYGITDAEKLGEFTSINTQTGNYTLVIGDKGATIEMNVGSANTLTIPPNSSVAFPLKTYINVTQLGAGQTTISPGSGVTIRAYNSGLKLAGQYAVATLYKRGTNEWVAGGNLVT